MRTPTTTLATALLATGLSPSVEAQDATEERLQDLERKVEILTSELSRKKPAGTQDRLSLGGYGQTFFKGGNNHEPNTAVPLRQTLYVGYRFNDWIVFDSELEFETEVEQEEEPSGELETEREHEAEIEFAYMDFLLDEAANFRVGLILTPLGIINQTHEPTTFLGNQRPIVERDLIPTTMRENGAGLYGRLAGGALDYQVYAQNSMDAKGLEPSSLHHAKQDG
ncbi:MAG TPA: hypothetical protein VKA48_04760, partial [Gammaproteobacteria bacterium]|nr:hypothetical protein [Gammaproteobacteria bacterium]